MLLHDISINKEKKSHKIKFYGNQNLQSKKSNLLSSHNNQFKAISENATILSGTGL